MTDNASDSSTPETADAPTLPVLSDQERSPTTQLQVLPPKIHLEVPTESPEMLQPSDSSDEANGDDFEAQRAAATNGPQPFGKPEAFL